MKNNKDLWKTISDLKHMLWELEIETARYSSKIKTLINEVDEVILKED